MVKALIPTAKIYPMKDTLENIFGLDLRGLGFLRISCGILLLADLAGRWPDLVAHYTDSGVLPRASLLALQGAPIYSLHMLSGSIFFQVFMFLIAAGCAIGLILGYRTGLMSVLSWVLLLSLHRRIPLVLDAGDVYLRVLLLWGMFLPWGERYSLFKNKVSLPTQFFSLATFGLSIHIFLIYFCNSVFKSGDDWRVSGSAIACVLNYDQASSFGHFLLRYPGSLHFLSFFVVDLERFGPFFWFFPWRTTTLRIISLLLCIFFHTGIALTMNIGLFPFVCIAPLIAMMPGRFWDLFTPELPTMAKGLIQKGFIYNLKNSLLFMMIIYIVFYNIGSLPYSRIKMPSSMLWIAYVLQQNQYWNMFSPNPPRDDGWIVVAGTLENNSKVNLFDRVGQPLNFHKPDHRDLFYKDQRWRSYLKELRYVGKKGYQVAYGNYLCHSWNKSHRGGQKLDEIEFIYMMELLSKDLKIKSPPKPKIIFTYSCSGRIDHNK